MARTSYGTGWADGLCPAEQRGHGGTQRRQTAPGEHAGVRAAGRSPHS